MEYKAKLNFRCNGVSCAKGDKYSGKDVELLLSKDLLEPIAETQVGTQDASEEKVEEAPVQRKRRGRPRKNPV